jgi:chitin-binding protein
MKIRSCRLTLIRLALSTLMSALLAAPALAQTASPGGDVLASLASVPGTPRQSCTPPLPPTTVFTSTATQTTLKVSWTPGFGDVVYKVFRGNRVGAYNRVGITTSTTLTDSGLTCGTSYVYVVIGSTGTCDSAYSSPSGGSTLSCSP